MYARLQLTMGALHDLPILILHKIALLQYCLVSVYLTGKRVDEDNQLTWSITDDREIQSYIIERKDKGNSYVYACCNCYWQTGEVIKAYTQLQI